MKKPLYFIALIGMIAVLFCACSQQKNKVDSVEKNSIIGKWELESEFSASGFSVPKNLEFFEDGTVNNSGSTGTYEISGNKITISVSTMDTYHYEFTLEDEKLSLRCTDTGYNNKTVYIYSRPQQTQEQEVTEQEPQGTEPSALAQSCDSVLCIGREENGDTYELVAVQEDTPTDVLIKVGVIKNGKWLVEPTEKHPFVDEQTHLLWRGYQYNSSIITFDTKQADEKSDGSSDLVKELAYKYFGYGSFGIYRGPIYNAENGKTLTIEGDTKPSIIFGRKENPPYQKIFVEEGDGHSIRLIDMADLTRSKPLLEEEATLYSCESEGLVGVYSDGVKYFDLNGKLCVDLSKYDIVKDERTQKEFQNGKLTFICKNEAGTYFQITVDTKGNILSQEKTSKE